jgi:chromosome segregation ATPase
MGRLGIDYEGVANAALRLAEAGQNPTVDSVRVALGGTGSKSTIAPLLKRWKTEHSAALAAPEAGLPAALLQAVKSVHGQMEAAAARQIALAEERERAAQDAAAQLVKVAEARSSRLEEEKTLLTAQCAETVNALTGLQAQLHARALELAALQSECAGLQMRLADRAGEVGTLNKQLAQARTQFDHYQEATIAQRNQDRQAADQRAGALEQALAAERRHCAELQASAASQAARLTQLTDENDRLRGDLHAHSAAGEALRAERDQLAFELKSALATQKAATEAARSAGDDLVAANIDLAAEKRQSEMLAAQLGQALATGELRQKEWEKERLELIHANAALLARQAARDGSAAAPPEGRAAEE